MERQPLNAEAETRTRCRVPKYPTNGDKCRRCIRDCGCERPILHNWSGLNIPRNNWRNFNDGNRDQHGWRGLCKKTRSDLSITSTSSPCATSAPRRRCRRPASCVDVSEPELLLSSTRLRLEHLRCIQLFHLLRKPFTRASCSESTWTKLLLLSAFDATEADTLFSASTSINDAVNSATSAFASPKPC